MTEKGWGEKRHLNEVERTCCEIRPKRKLSGTPLGLACFPIALAALAFVTWHRIRGGLEIEALVARDA